MCTNEAKETFICILFKQAIFNGLFLMFFNICFCACPIFYYGLTEQPYSQEELLKYPQLYTKNRKNALMSMKNFLPWLISGIWHAMVCYYMTFFAWNNFDHMNDLACFGTVICVGAIAVVNIKVIILFSTILALRNMECNSYYWCGWVSFSDIP